MSQVDFITIGTNSGIIQDSDDNDNSDDCE